MNTKFDTLPADRLEDASHAINTMMEVLGQSRLQPSFVDSLAGYGVKRCTVCLSIKPLESFHRDSSRRDGLSNKCKPCNGASVDHHRETREAHQERVEQGKREFIREASEYIPPAPQGRLPVEVLSDAGAAVEVILDKFYQGRATPRFNDVLRAWEVKRCHRCTQLKHPESFNKRADKRDGLETECRDCQRERVRSYAAEHREEYRERTARWRENNQIRRRLYAGKVRAERAGAVAEEITEEEMLSYWEQQGIDPTRCFYTGEELTSQNISIDHKTPFKRGGEHTMANLVPCTWAANDRKNTRTAEEFQELLAEEQESNND